MSDGLFKREIKDHWTISYNQNGYPHVQQGWVLPPGRHVDFDPFILMAEDWFKRGVFADHPHRGFQTITYVVDGRLEHKDNEGGHSILEAGDVQYMNAGRGGRHAEQAYEDDLIHTLQLWLNLPKSLKDTQMSYQNAFVEDVPVVPFEGGAMKVYAGELEGEKGPLESLVPINMAELSFKEGATYTYKIPANHNAFIYVLSGELAFGENKTTLQKTGVASITFEEHAEDGQVSELTIQANSRAKFLIYAGKPIREELVAGGPFVMNTEEEIKQAYRDYHEGKFGPAID